VELPVKENINTDISNRRIEPVPAFKSVLGLLDWLKSRHLNTFTTGVSQLVGGALAVKILMPQNI